MINKLKKPNITLMQLLLVVAYSYYPLASFVAGIFYHVPFLSPLSPYIYPGVIVILILFNLRELIAKIRVMDILVLIILLIIVLLSYVINISNRQFIVDALPELFLQVVPFYFVGICWDPRESTFHYIYYVSVFALVVNLAYLLLFTAASGGLDYNMSTAYKILPATMVCWWYFIKEEKVAIFFAAIGTFMLLFLGTRGPVVILICYLIVLVWDRITVKKRIALTITGIVFSYLVAHNNWLVVLSMKLSLFASKHGLSTRLFDILSRGEMFSYTSGRDYFYEVITQKIFEKPLIGYGIYGDRQFVGDSAHRIWLEIWCHFGVVFGSILMIFMFYLIYKGLKSAQSDKMKQFILLWTVHLFIRGIFGSDYLSYYSALLFGLCVCSIRSINYENKLSVIHNGMLYGHSRE